MADEIIDKSLYTDAAIADLEKTIANMEKAEDAVPMYYWPTIALAIIQLGHYLAILKAEKERNG
jgi:hypothetical protein